MKRFTTAAISFAILWLALASASFAQVKQVEMKIDGYLCGN